jgi:hypothetical protein
MFQFDLAHPGVIDRILIIPSLLEILYSNYQQPWTARIINGIQQADEDQLNELVEICGNDDDPITLINNSHIFDDFPG